MKAVFSVASIAFRESIRNRTLLAILFLALGFVISARLLAELALDERVRVITDWGLFCVSIFGVALAIINGVTFVHKEVRRKTLYVVLSRPIHRSQYVVGKYLGLALTLIVEVSLLSLALAVLLYAEGVTTQLLLLTALWLNLMEILLVAAIALFFASFSTPVLSGLFTLGVFLVGRSLPVLDQLLQKITSPIAANIAKGFFLVLPDLADFNISTQVVHGVKVPLSEVLTLTSYGLSLTVVLLVLSSLIFSKRDLT